MTDPNPVIWIPSAEELKNSSLAKFRDVVNSKYGLALKNYDDIHAWSVNPKTAGDFWMALFSFLDIGASKAPQKAFPKVRARFIGEEGNIESQLTVE